MTPTVTPTDATDKTIAWSSDKNGDGAFLVNSSSANGANPFTVELAAVGTGNLSLYAYDMGGASATIPVTVTAA